MYNLENLDFLYKLTKIEIKWIFNTLVIVCLVIHRGLLL